MVSKMGLILFTVLTSFWQVAFSAKINITPVRFDGLVITAVNITCLSDNAEHSMKEILGIQVLKGEQEIASLRQGSPIAYGSNLTTVVQADGSVHPNISLSYLRLNIPHVLTQDSGKYTCNVYYVNKAGFFDVDKVWDNLVVDDQAFQTHMAFLMRKVFVQADTINEQARQIENQASQLEELKHLFKNEGYATGKKLVGIEDISQNHSRDIKELKEKALQSARKVGALESFSRIQPKDMKDMTCCNNGNFSTIFSAYISKPGKKVNDGDLLVYGDIKTKVGNGYNKLTGHFTAPYKGLYAFHVSLTLKSGIHAHILLQVDGNEVARLRVGDEDYYDQSSLSCVLQLDAGNVVNVKANSGTLELSSHKESSMFTGYLLETL